MIEGQPPPRPDQIQDALFRVVTPEFLPTIGARMREGRFFGREDRADSLPVVIINETFANAHFPGVSPLGRRIQMGATGPNRPWQTIVGVVKEVRERGIDIGTKPAVYWPQAQGANAWPVPQDLAVRTSVPPLSVVNEVRAAIVAVDKDQPVQRVRTMEEVHAEGFAVRRQSMNLLAVFAGLALALAALGVYGVLSFAVTQRTREIGVRLALGAQPSGIVGIVVGQGLALAGAGLAIGIAASLAATRMLGSLLYGVPARDPATLIAVAAVLALVALLACYFPARRASRVDPCVALREE
jgi:predicted permease